MNKNLLFFTGYFFLFFSIFSFTACEEDCEIPTDPSCKNYDPCWEKSPVSANFTMWERVPDDDTLQVSNSVYMNRNLILVADQDHENYRWQIGNDPKERTGKSAVVYFGRPYEDIKITLIVSDIPNTNCHPGDDGIDTVSKTIQVRTLEDLPIWGSFKGMDLDHPDDPFTIKVAWDSTWFGFYPNIRNLPEGCTVAANLGVGAAGFTIIPSLSTDDCYSVRGVGHLNKDSLRIEYSYFDPTLQSQVPPVLTLIKKTFIGKKL